VFILNDLFVCVRRHEKLFRFVHCLGLFDTCPCDATALRVAQT